MGANKYGALLLWTLHLAGCGAYDTSQVTSLVQAIDPKLVTEFSDKADVFGVSCLGLSPGWTHRASYYTGGPQEVQQACQSPFPVWSCNDNWRIAMRTDGDFCQMVVVELLHGASYLAYGTWDYYYERDFCGERYDSVFVRLCNE
jgi:hypothetical protein